MLTVHYYSSWNTSDTHVQSTKLGYNNQSSDTACPNAMMQGICGTSSIHDVTKFYCTSVWFVQKLRYEYIYYFVWIWRVCSNTALTLTTTAIQNYLLNYHNKVVRKTAHLYKRYIFFLHMWLLIVVVAFLQ